MEVLPKWVVGVMEVQQLDKKIEEQSNSTSSSGGDRGPDES